MDATWPNIHHRVYKSQTLLACYSSIRIGFCEIHVYIVSPLYFVSFFFTGRNAGTVNLKIGYGENIGEFNYQLDIIIKNS